jgi:hypothetical protein
MSFVVPNSRLIRGGATLMRACGSAARRPFVPAASSIAALPRHSMSAIVLFGLRRYCKIVHMARICQQHASAGTVREATAAHGDFATDERGYHSAESVQQRMSKLQCMVRGRV